MNKMVVSGVIQGLWDVYDLLHWRIVEVKNSQKDEMFSFE